MERERIQPYYAAAGAAVYRELLTNPGEYSFLGPVVTEQQFEDAVVSVGVYIGNGTSLSQTTQWNGNVNREEWERMHILCNKAQRGMKGSPFDYLHTALFYDRMRKGLHLYPDIPTLSGIGTLSGDELLLHINPHMSPMVIINTMTCHAARQCQSYVVSK